MNHELVTRALTLKSVREETREVDFVASTDAVDAYGDIVEQSWRLERYLANPVVLFAHDSRSLPIGKAPKTGVIGGELVTTIQFATEAANPLAEQVWQSVREGTLRAVSVGFIPNEVRAEKRDGKTIYVLADNELHEISVVPIPANPEALAKMRARAVPTKDVAGMVPAATAAAALDAPRREESQMTIEELKALLAQRDADLDKERKAAETARSEATTMKAALAAAETRVTALTEERNALADRCKLAEAEVVKHEVESFIGTKALPAEREALTELATTNISLFRKTMAARGALKILGEQVVKSEKKEDAPAPTTATNGAGEDLASKFTAELSKGG